jgi:hypothetical protein
MAKKTKPKGKPSVRIEKADGGYILECSRQGQYMMGPDDSEMAPKVFQDIDDCLDAAEAYLTDGDPAEKADEEAENKAGKE